MCTMDTPKVEQPTQKPPVYMSNPFLDGLGIGAESRGRNSLRIDPGSPVPTRTSVTPPVNPGTYGGGLGMGLGSGNYGGNLGMGGGIGIGTRTYVR